MLCFQIYLSDVFTDDAQEKHLKPSNQKDQADNGCIPRHRNGKEYLLELPLHADVAVIKAWKADTAGNIKFRLTARATNNYMAYAADTVIVEVEELVEVGEIGPDEVDVAAPIIDMVYVRTGEKKPLCPMWQRAKAKAEGGK